MIIADAGKYLIKKTIHFDDKTHNKEGMEENFLNLLKAMHEKPIANIITPNGEYWKISS